MRLIDADALLKEVLERACDLTQEGLQRIMFAMAVDNIANAHAIEAKPVVHAHWKCDSNIDDFYCSNCGSKALRDYFENEVQSNYCPSCGAQMDEVVE